MREHSVQAIANAPPDAEVIFLSTDSAGTPGALNSQILTQLNLPMALPSGDELAQGYALRNSRVGLICYVVTIDGRPTNEALEHNLGLAFSDPQVASAASYWVPLMGTGAGGLSHEESFAITAAILQAQPTIQNGKARTVIALPPDLDGAVRKTFAALARKLGRVIVADDLDALAHKRRPEHANIINPYRMPRSAAVTDLLELASTFAPMVKRSGVSTSLLFFALGEGHGPVTETALFRDGAAEFFTLTLEELYADQYDTAWKHYFGDTRRPSGVADTILPPTDNVAAVLVEAHARAGGDDHAIQIDHVIGALLEHQDTRLRNLLEDAGIVPEALLAEYRDARLGRVATRFQNDVANSDDQLDYARYATAIRAFLTDKDTRAPLSISVQAPWGGGKSTLMHLVREALDPQEVRGKYKQMPLAELRKLPKLLLGKVTELLEAREEILVTPDEQAARSKRRWTVWFNAWKYETTEQLWAGLVDAIVSQIAQRLSPLEREKFLLKLQLARIDDGIVRKRIYDRIVNLWWRKAKVWAVAAGSIMLSLFGLAAAKPELDPALQRAVGLWSGSGFIYMLIVQAILTLGFLISFAASSFKTKKEPASFSLADVIKVPDYDKGVGELHHVHADLKRVLELVPHKGEDGDSAPLVIFIDDLDRCSPGKVASVVEGVSMLLATDEYRCIFVIGMDPQMVAAALEKAHEDVRQKLPSYERAVPLGWRFMDKFVQLPFTLPPSETGAFTAYVDWLAGVASPAPAIAATRSEAMPQPSVPPAADHTIESVIREIADGPSADTPLQPAPEPETIATFTESRNVGAIIRRIAQFSVGNPREMKRMVNLARFYLTLRAARSVKEPAWHPPNAGQYARWIALTLRWPDMLRWLQWGADEARWPPEELGVPLIVRRLRALEAHAERAEAPAAWRNALKEELSLPTDSESNWSRDAKLFEFFVDEVNQPRGERLSDAAERGFW
ncbi:KAP family P-loop NTPase fold protein [Allosphingosinicella deserti]|nr:P-loop NTPase fold protein [Sphingomonas deserti]